MENIEYVYNVLKCLKYYQEVQNFSTVQIGLIIQLYKKYYIPRDGQTRGIKTNRSSTLNQIALLIGEVSNEIYLSSL